jgi:hypothetical protein
MRIETRMFRQNGDNGVWTPEAVRSLIGQTVPARDFDVLGFVGDTITIIDAWIEDGWVLGTFSDQP